MFIFCNYLFIKMIFFKSSILHFTMMGIGELINMLLQSLYLYNYLEDRELLFSVSILLIFIFALAALALIYLLIKTLIMKKNITEMGNILNQEAEVVKLLNDLGTRGWLYVYGENWKFQSATSLKIGDIVKITDCKKTILTVKKVL